MPELTALPQYGRYQTLSILGRGGCGIVYKAWDPEIQRLVAIKTPLTYDLVPGEIDNFAARFRREARAAGKLEHPNIVSIYDYGDDDGKPYFVMEYLQGETLQQRITRERIIRIENALPLFFQLCSAMQYAHASKMIHRDLKPSNIMLLKTGSIKVVDFGIVKSLAAELTHKGGLLGTPHYMSPESLSGTASDHRADIFSLGVMLYEALAGAKPFDGENFLSLSFNMVHLSPVPPGGLNPAINPALSSVILKALAKDPAQRYQSCRALADDLKRSADLQLSGMTDSEIALSELQRRAAPVDDVLRSAIDIDCQTTTLLPSAAQLGTETPANSSIQNPEARSSDTPTSSLGIPLHEEFSPEAAALQSEHRREGLVSARTCYDLDDRIGGVRAVATPKSPGHPRFSAEKLRWQAGALLNKELDTQFLSAAVRRPMVLLSLIFVLSLPPAATLALHVARRRPHAGVAPTGRAATRRVTVLAPGSEKSQRLVGRSIPEASAYGSGGEKPKTIPLARSKYGRLQVLVTDDNGQSLAGAEVILSTLAGRQASDSLYTDSDGIAAFTFLPGKYTVEAREAGTEAIISATARIFRAKLTQLRLQLHSTSVAQSARRPQATALATSSLFGRVAVAGLGIGVANVPVQILRSNGEVVESFRTDENGDFRAAGLVANTYDVAVSSIFPLRAKRVQCPPVEPGRTSACTLLLDPPVFRFRVTQRHLFSCFSGFLTVTDNAIVLTETQMGSARRVVGFGEPLRSLTIRRWKAFGVEIQAGDGTKFRVSLRTDKNVPAVTRSEVELLMKLTANFKGEVDLLLKRSQDTTPSAGALLSLAKGNER